MPQSEAPCLSGKLCSMRTVFAVCSMLAGQSRLQQAMWPLQTFALVSQWLSLVMRTIAQLTHHLLTQDARGSQRACPCATACAPLRGGPWPPLTCLPCWLNGHNPGSALLVSQVSLWSCAWLRSPEAFSGTQHSKAWGSSHNQHY